ncbi:MAG TPA: hypothetical protein VGS22_15325 [Thermoanaerobaculia bacterium]|nr:hypothetical protein [Thermoanaerobaculia bacterium]
MTFRLAADGAVPLGTALTETGETLRRRLDQMGVHPAVVETAGTDQVVVRILRRDDSEQIRHALLQTAVFELRFVRPAGGGPALSSEEAVLAQFGGRLPADLEILPLKATDKEGADAPRYYAVERQPVLTGRDIQSARSMPGYTGRPVVEFTVKPEPAKALAEATGANMGSIIAIVLDGQVVSSAILNARIGESGMIEGNFTPAEADDLAFVLASGPIPGRITLIEESGGSPASRRP